MSDETRTVAWIDYIIASQDPADEALAREFLAGQWAHSQTMQWIMRDTAKGGLTETMMHKLGEEQERAAALQNRIFHRAQELVAAGAAPADEATSIAWNERRIALCPTFPTDETDSHA